MNLRNDLSSVVQHLTSKGYKIDTVFDVGANKGLWTQEFEKIMTDACFYLFEANPNLPCPKTLAPKHKWFNGVLSNPETTEVDFYSISGTGDSYYKEQTKHYNNCEPMTLPTTTLDKMVAEHSLPMPQLIKLDTQGSELDVLEGSNNVLKHVDIVVTEIATLPYNLGAPNFNDYMTYLSKFDYVPMGLEGFHFVDNMLAQLDIVFLKRDVKAKYYGDKKLFT